MLYEVSFYTTRNSRKPEKEIIRARNMSEAKEFVAVRFGAIYIQYAQTFVYTDI